jgi:succinate dehydrogenase / fumarate reductase cytochrome b subunit
MKRLARLWGASIGRKLIAAGTGSVLLAFLIGHLYGNLKIFQGPEKLNGYSAWLKGHPGLWVFRAGLLGIFIVHVYVTLSLARENRAARPVGYQRWRAQSSNVASRSMMWTGLFVLVFILYHLLHFTFGVVDAEATRMALAQKPLDIYSMVVGSFRNPWVSGSYVLAMIVLGFHLIHGTVSAVQTAGIHHESYQTLIRIVCVVVTAVIVLGMSSIPILVYLGKLVPHEQVVAP